MNLRKINGEFQDAVQLCKALLKEYLQYDYQFMAESVQELEFSTFKMKITEAKGQRMLGIAIAVGGRIEIEMVGLSELVQETAQFPLRVSGNIVDFVQKDKLKEILERIKQMLNGEYRDTSQPSFQKAVQAVDTASTASALCSRVDQSSTSGLQDSRPMMPNLAPSFGQPRFPEPGRLSNPPVIGAPGPSSSIGRSDLDPHANRDMTPGGGMIVGPDHPIFQNPYGSGGIEPSIPNFGGSQPLGSHPHGARFDPVFPFGSQPGNPGVGRGRGRYSGDPDNDAFMPPGGGNYM